jgi:hypothetical protein
MSLYAEWMPTVVAESLRLRMVRTVLLTLPPPVRPRWKLADGVLVRACEECRRLKCGCRFAGTVKARLGARV